MTNNDELRRLSVQVAEKIMGCKPHHRDDGTWWCFCGDTGWPGDPNNTHRSGPSKALADYASEGNAMLALIAKMEAEGWAPLVGIDAGGWFCTFEQRRHADAHANGDTLPEAVARAALAAVGHR